MQNILQLLKMLLHFYYKLNLNLVIKVEVFTKFIHLNELFECIYFGTSSARKSTGVGAFDFGSWCQLCQFIQVYANYL